MNDGGEVGEVGGGERGYPVREGGMEGGRKGRREGVRRGIPDVKVRQKNEENTQLRDRVSHGA